MLKTHIRSYSINEDGDIVVVRWAKGDRVDISTVYDSVPRDRRELRAGTYLDVFRYDDDQLAWSGSPNGHDVRSAQSFALLLDLFVEDVKGPADDRRGF